ncbi:HTH-type transcriptional regulator GntR [Variibacter gotjawalensis]|uniref:HTH-type transcriptional regulator GntR n=1 Tax=Variibacter gotjawalensis TaxID=1333996 RepID=A0A0S3PRR2_9BRAD|nr:LacI family DNA-binding transcriptional regulator [Variibacter gotjawalensis]NIK48939.1 LacI family gluconate utilization system Gnt-I transcriptional repressor [Variibacter gotjawalensis]RZS50795.1 LacI family transcriptional regulator [Variibacter gotjawalensis]BAT58629.1 HTH-type transcriptional regulator GntR [Variibacter gotjawalensis]
MNDVAERAGVSQMTVSRALRTPDLVAPATRARVEAAMAELDYVPDLLAGSLAARRSGLIAAVISTFENAIFAQTIAGLTACVEAAGFSILLGSSDYSATDEERLLRAILGRRPDGVVLTGTLHTPRARRLLTTAGVPVVETWELPADPVDMAVGFDNPAAGRAMTLALHSYGYRRIGFISPSDENDRRGLQRREGYRAAVKELRIEPREVSAHAVITGMESGPQLLDEMLKRFPDTDAIFCSLDAIAAGVLLAAQRRGIKTPSELAISGFGDFAIAQPSGLDLTTVHIGGRDIGTRAGELLLARMRDEEVPTPIVDIGYEIIRRTSA